jgi:hypothetical protein
MRVDFRFPLQIAVTLGAAALVLAYPLAHYASWDVILGVMLGAFLSTFNVLLGFAAIEYAFDRSYSVFLRTVLGGMGLRLILMLGMMMGLILMFHVHVVALTISLLGFYLVYLVLEVLFIQRKMLENH